MDKQQIKNTNYFSHDSNARNDEKIIRLRMKQGAAGYGVYFMILERLREERNYMSAKDYNMIAFDLRVDASLVKSVIEDFGLFAFTEDGKCFYSESFNSRMEAKDTSAAKRSAAGKKGMASRYGKTSSEKEQGAVATTGETLFAEEHFSPLSMNLSPVNNDECYERFFSEDNSANMELLLMNFGLKPTDKPRLRKVAKEVIAEWKMSEKQHANYTDWSQHLIATMRIKCQQQKTSKGNTASESSEPPTQADYQYDNGFGSQDV